MAYYNFARTHLSLNKDAPMPRAVQLGAFKRTQFSADYIITMFGFDFRQGQPVRGGAGVFWGVNFASAFLRHGSLRLARQSGQFSN